VAEPLCLIVFARAPVPGTTKTRLISRLGADGAAALQERLIQRTLGTAAASSLRPVELWCTPGTGHPFFARCAAEFRIVLRCQGAGDLGDRMGRALESALRNHPGALLVGTDCPALTVSDFEQAAGALKAGADAVLVPAEDGGYVLVGLRRFDPSVFSAIPWGTGAVLQCTRERFRRLGWRWNETRTCWDMDRPEDVDRLMSEGIRL